MAYDFKKERRDLYMPKRKPSIVEVPPMSFVAVRGQGNPNAEGGEYQRALEALYAISYTIKMSKMGDHRIEGYFDYVVPPLEGFWWQEGVQGIDYARKEDFQWISAIRLPDFIDEGEFAWAVAEAEAKKGKDFSKAGFLTIDEGLCVQALHVGPYDDEPATIAAMDAYLAEAGYVNDFGEARHHHEIYLSDPRRTAPEKLKTVIRHPVRTAWACGRASSTSGS